VIQQLTCRVDTLSRAAKPLRKRLLLLVGDKRVFYRFGIVSSCGVGGFRLVGGVGYWTGVVGERKAYKTDLTDAE
jgi:hypothetical protein